MPTHSLSRVARSCLAALLLVLLATVPAMAGGDPSEDSCAGLGMLTVQCFQCSTGRYLGVINSAAGYDAHNKDCLKSINAAKQSCSGAYGVPTSDIGMKWMYKIRLTEWRNWNPRNNCPCAQW